MAGSSLLYILVSGDLPAFAVVHRMIGGIDSFPLLAVPFFMFLGRILNAGSITDRLLKVADGTVGHIRGGLGHVNVFVSMVFASLSGSAAADTASVGVITSYSIHYTKLYEARRRRASRRPRRPAGSFRRSDGRGSRAGS